MSGWASAGRLVVALTLALTALTAGVTAGEAQVFDFRCPDNAPATPNDGFISGGIGLTCQEWVARYGPPDEIGQSDLIYHIGGVRVFGMGSPGLRLQFADDTWRRAGVFPNEFQAALSFLPADAEYLGVADLATGLRSYQAANIFFSPSLTARNAALGFARPGLILVITNFAPGGIERGPIETIQVVQTALRG
jgi:hypothetical protein